MDIQDLLSEKFGSYRYTNNDDEIRFCCPYCNDGGFHLYINIDKQVLHCFKCGTSESLIKIFGKYLQNYGKISIQKKRTYPVMEGIEPLEGAKTYLSKLAREYCQLRGIVDMSTLYYGVSKDWFGRIVFSIIEEERIVVAVGRTFIPGLYPKYYVQGDKSQYIYLLDKMKYSPYIVICEGCIDALSCKYGVALLGKEMSRIQRYKLYLSIPPERPMYIALDPDAKREGIKMARILSSHYEKVYFCNLPDGSDLNDLKGDWGSYPHYQITKNNFIKMSHKILGV